jgi:drug/metabolite transporter (DMT)-like permease
MIAGVLLLHEHPGLLAAIGAISVIAGVWMTRAPNGSLGSVIPALLIGLTIFGYTTIDRIGVRVGPFWLYSWAVFAATAIFMARWRGRQQISNSVSVGILNLAAYGLVLAALSIAPLVLVAPLRETGVVLVSLWGIVRLGERHGAVVRLMGAGAVLAGIALVAVSGG